MTAGVGSVHEERVRRVKLPTINLWIGWKPLRHYKPFFDSQAKIRGMQGGVRAAKSTHATAECVVLASSKNGNIHSVIREDLGDILSSILPEYVAFFERAGTIIRPFHTQRHNMFVATSDGGQAEIRFIGLKTHSKQSTGSTKWSSTHICEASEIGRTAFDWSLTRLNFGSERMVVEWNPVPKTNWLYDVFANPETKNPEAEFFQYSTYDNPHLSESYIRSQEQAHRLYPEWISRNLRGNWGQTGYGTPVYPMFRRTLHCIPVEDCDGEDIVVGLDFGFHNPAIISGSLKNMCVKVAHSALYHDRTDDQFADEVLKVMRDYYPRSWAQGKVTFYGDPAGAQAQSQTGSSTIEVFRARGIHVRNPFEGQPKAAREINNGVGVVQAQLSALGPGSLPKLSFMDRPANEALFEALEDGYHFPGEGERKEFDSRGALKPVKDNVNDHLPDACRYMVVGVFGVSGIADANADLSSFLAVRGDKYDGPEPADLFGVREGVYAS